MMPTSHSVTVRLILWAHMPLVAVLVPAQSMDRPWEPLSLSSTSLNTVNRNHFKEDIVDFFSSHKLLSSTWCQVSNSHSGGVDVQRKSVSYAMYACRKTCDIVKITKMSIQSVVENGNV